MKTYEYTDGGRYAEVSVRFTLDKQGMKNALAYWAVSLSGESAESLPNPGKREAVKLIRDALRENGKDVYVWADQLDEDEEAAYSEWADKQFDRHFARDFR